MDIICVVFLIYAINQSIFIAITLRHIHLVRPIHVGLLDH